MIRIFISLFVANFTISILNSQNHSTPWTLEQCIEYAINNSIDVKREELVVDYQEIQKKQALYNITPSVGANFTHQWTNGRSPNPYSYEWEQQNLSQGNIRGGFDEVLFSGLKNFHLIEQSKIDFKKSLKDLDAAKNSIMVNVATYYLEILFNQEIVYIAKNQLDVTNIQIERTEKLVEAGSVAKGDLLEIRSQAAAEKVNLVEAKNKLRASKLNLIQALNLDSIGDFQIVTPGNLNADTMFLKTVESVYNEGVSNYPEVLSAELEVQSVDKSIRIARSDYYPSINLFGSLNSNYTVGSVDPFDETLKYPVSEQVNDNIYQTIGVSVNIPIFNQHRTKTNVQTSQIQLEDSKYQLKLAKLNLYKSIQQAHNNALAAFEKYNSSNEAMTSFRESFKYTSEKFELGLVNSFDYNVAKNNLTKAESDFLQAKYEYIFSVNLLEFYTGKRISL